MTRAALWLLGIGAAFYFCFVVMGAVWPGRVVPIAQTPKAVDIHLIGGPIHYDYLLPLDAQTRSRFAWLGDDVQLDHPLARWLVVGWGARGFYTTTGDYSDVRLSTVWQGLTGDASVMRVDLAGALSDDIISLRLSLSTAQYAALLDHIEQSFANGADSLPLDVPGLSGGDRFYAAKGRFSLLSTCNVWVGQSLRAAGVQFGAWTPLPQTVRLSHWLYQR